MNNDLMQQQMDRDCEKFGITIPDSMKESLYMYRAVDPYTFQPKLGIEIFATAWCGDTDTETERNQIIKIVSKWIEGVIQTS